MVTERLFGVIGTVGRFAHMHIQSKASGTFRDIRKTCVATINWGSQHGAVTDRVCVCVRVCVILSLEAESLGILGISGNPRNLWES
eukprot:3396398-Pyramimonas_sp.AAC.1